MTTEPEYYTYVPIKDLIEAPNGLVQHYRNHWWMVHPEHGLTFYTRMRGGRDPAPQCNSDERITRKLAGITPWLQVRKIEHVYVKSDYEGRLSLPSSAVKGSSADLQLPTPLAHQQQPSPARPSKYDDDGVPLAAEEW